ncbi:MAG TPA: hypothetical protein VD995_20835 [Azospirillum sp.]|nr:hypothetical protein [Azospirillum sp.]
MALARSSSYEVQLYQVDHWVLDGRFEDEAEARNHAKRILSGGKVEGYRIVRDWQRPDGRHIETELCSEFRAQSNALTISPIDEPPPVCRTVDQCYTVESRMVMNRLLRTYVERLVVTPTEIMHNYPELKRLLDKDNLVPTAVGRVAALQAEKAGLDGRERRDEMYRLVDAVTERARKASARQDLPDVAKSGFGPAFEALSKKETPEDRTFYAKVLVSRDLVQMRNWLAKLDYLAGLVREDGGLAEEPLELVDGIIADVLGAPSVAQELLGMQRSLAEALCNLLDLSRGRLVADGRPDDDRALMLSELLAFNDLDETRLVILDLVRRQLRSAQPLYRNDPAAERDAFDAVLRRATGPDGMLGGGGGMAEALVQRYMRFLEAGGATGRRQSINEVIARLPDAKDRVRFLLALADSDLGRQHADDVTAALRQLTGDVTAVARFVSRDQPIKANLEELTRLYRQVAESTAPEPLRTTLAENIDDLLCAYIVGSRVVERLDNPDDILRHRANRLIQLCAPGTLQSRKALDIVRQRVVAHLRQPNFEHRYIEDIVDPAVQQKALRDFFKLLGDAGFR